MINSKEVLMILSSAVINMAGDLFTKKEFDFLMRGVAEHPDVDMSAVQRVESVVMESGFSVDKASVASAIQAVAIAITKAALEDAIDGASKQSEPHLKLVKPEGEE